MLDAFDGVAIRRRDLTIGPAATTLMRSSGAHTTILIPAKATCGSLRGSAEPGSRAFCALRAQRTPPPATAFMASPSPDRPRLFSVKKPVSTPELLPGS